MCYSHMQAKRNKLFEEKLVLKLIKERFIKVVISITFDRDFEQVWKMRQSAVNFLWRQVLRRVHDALWWALCCALVLVFIYILTIGTHIESRPALSKVFLFSQLVCWKNCMRTQLISVWTIYRLWKLHFLIS